MKRSDLEKRAISSLQKEGYTCERAYNKAVFIPGKGYVGKRFDFFHVIDIIAIQDSEIRFIQVTSEDSNPESKHHSRNGSDAEYNHMKKIQRYWGFAMPIELWTYEKIHNKWEVRIKSYIHARWYEGVITNVIKNPVTGVDYPVRPHKEVIKE